MNPANAASFGLNNRPKTRRGRSDVGNDVDVGEEVTAARTISWLSSAHARRRDRFRLEMSNLRPTKNSDAAHRLFQVFLVQRGLRKRVPRACVNRFWKKIDKSQPDSERRPFF